MQSLIIPLIVKKCRFYRCQ